MLKKLFQKHNIYLTGLLITLNLIGGITLYSSVNTGEQANISVFVKQVILVVLLLLIYFGISFINLDILKYKKTHIFLYLLVIFSLIFVLFFTKSVKGAARWIPITGDFGIQPSEIAKIVLTLVGAYVVTQWKHITAKNRNKWIKNPLFPFIGFMLPVLFLILVQPALGTTIIVVIMLIAIMYFSTQDKLPIWLYAGLIFIIVMIWSFFGSNNVIVSLLFSIGVVGIVYAALRKKLSLAVILLILLLTSGFMYSFSTVKDFNFLGSYQRARINCWVNQDKLTYEEKTDMCFQQVQAKTSIGSGEMFGKGFSIRTTSLPEFNNDFIYAAFAEQFGYIGTLLLLIIYFLFIFEIVRASVKQESEFSRVVILSFGIMYTIQVFVNISMNLGVLPVTGISLPFMSSGGSFLLVSILGVGIIQNLSHNVILPDNEQFNRRRWEDYGD